MKSMQLPRPK